MHEKYLFVFRSLTLDRIYLIGIIDQDVVGATELAEQQCWSIRATDVIKQIHVHSSCKCGECFCEVIDREDEHAG